jgi:hypothetical protein
MTEVEQGVLRIIAGLASLEQKYNMQPTKKAEESISAGYCKEVAAKELVEIENG